MHSGYSSQLGAVTVYVAGMEFVSFEIFLKIFAESTCIFKSNVCQSVFFNLIKNLCIYGV